MGNPFEVRVAEVMDVREVAVEFVVEHTEHTKLASHTHTIVWGSRGSGKSMHLRYLEPMAQAYARGTGTDADVHEMLSDPDAFLGVYINCRDGALSRAELRQVGTLANRNDGYVQGVLSHYLACAVAERIADTLLSQVTFLASRPCDATELPLWLSGALEETPDDMGGVFRALRRLGKEWRSDLGKRVDALCTESEAGRAVPLPRDMPHITPDLEELCRLVQRAGGIVAPVFLLFDEANELSEVHQLCVNSLIARRSQQCMCVKVASQKNGFLFGWKLEGEVDETHDFTTIDLDGLYTNNGEAYYRRIEQIGDRRLKRAGVELNVHEYLPPNEGEVNALAAARELAEARYDALPPEGRPKDRANFVKKYAPAIMLQEVLSPKGGRTYAGFANLVHLSSGIVRSFIDSVGAMYDRYVEEHPNREPRSIPVSIQGQVISAHSDAMIEAHLVDKVRKLAPDSPQRVEREGLKNLLDGLGKLFRARLMDKESREPRIISVSLKDAPDTVLGRILDLAEQEAFLHVKWYRSKRGNQNLRCYVLNRRLCPHYNLDVTGFQGRLELAAVELARSLYDPEGFYKAAARQAAKDESDTSQLSLFEW